MGARIEFFFDFSSPYGYLASTQIDGFADKHGAHVDWRPYLMGAAYKQSGRSPMMDQNLIGQYSVHDVARFGRMQGTPIRMPEPFPVATVAACRLYYWLFDQDPGAAKDLAKKLYADYFVNGINIGSKENVLATAKKLGHDADAAAAALEMVRIKQIVREVTDGAIARGIFGSPFFMVDDEPFWGADRLWMIKRWIKSGGW